MPIRSQQQWKFLFATDKPFARRWAEETPGGKGARYRKLPVKVRTKAPNYGAKRGQVIAGRLVRGEGGRFSSSGGASTSTRVPPKQLPKAPAAPKGRGRKAPKLAKPKQTPEQRAAEQAKRRQERAQQRQAEREQNIAKTFQALGLPEDAADSLRRLAAGEVVDDDGGLVKMGLAEQARDGSYRLTADGRQMMHAAERGDLGAARDARSRGADRYAAGQDRAAAQRERQGKKLSAAMQRAAQAKPKKVGGGGSKKKPPVVRRLPARSSSRPQAARSGGGEGGSSDTTAKPELPRQLIDAARALSAGQATDEELLIRNGLAKRGKDGRIVLTAQGLRAIRTKDYTPTRTTDAGHTGVMVALYPDAAAVKTIASAAGVTEPQEQLHLTLCFLGDSTEQPLATNKEKVIAAVEEWAQQHGQPMKGVVNGLGRFFHSESDDTNAVYVAPDVPGLPEQRQSLAEWIEKSGFDYSHDHGFTPHITVAYVPLDAPTPPIRVETPIAFDRVTLAWGDEQYEFPLGVRTKSFAVFKDARGQDRWIARTTTAFEDRDAEVISTKALEDSAASDAPRGPLRFWHMGRPDPLSADAPWGPGVDLGWCDFAATHGRTLIESGTFKSAAIARAVAAKADQLELSPGFFHAPMEPDASGVFHHIRIFERSLVPKWAGRASNPYTGLVVEKAMDPKKESALRELGIPEPVIKELLAEVATTEKAADAEGVRYKAEDEKPTLISTLRQWLGVDQVVTTKEETPAAETPADPIAVLKAQLDAMQTELAALKAAPPVAVETQADEMVEVETDDVPMDDMGGEMSADDFLAAIASIVAPLAEKIDALAAALDVVKTMGTHVEKFNTALSAYTTQKDDAQAQAAEQVAALKAQIDQQQAALADSQAKLNELIDDAPRGGYRPSQAQDNVNIWANPQLLAAMKDGDASDAPFVADDGMSITDHFFGTPKR